MTRRRPRRGFKLVEVLVVIFIVGVLISLLIEASFHGRGPGRKTQCQNNMRQLGLALLGSCNAKGAFPQAGTFEDDPDVHQGDPTRSVIHKAITDPGRFTDDPGPCRSNWVVAILPYLDNQELYNAWSFDQPYTSTLATEPDGISNEKVAAISIGILRCPDDMTAVPDHGNLSYAVNGGFVRWGAIPVGWDGDRPDGKAGNGGVLRWTRDGADWDESRDVCKKLGVMSLGTTTGSVPWDVRTRPSDIVDGAFATIMVGENTAVGASEGTPYSGNLPTNWACPLPNFCMFLASDDVCQSADSATNCLGGQLRPTPARISGPGWSRANRAGKGEGINGSRPGAVEGSYPFAQSEHGGGANFVFCDGSVRFLTSTLDGTVYARLITPAGEALPAEIRQGVLSHDDIGQ